MPNVRTVISHKTSPRRGIISIPGMCVFMSADIVSQPARHRTDRGYREEVIRKMRASGCRITHQRELIVGVILENKYPTIKEIYNEVKKMDPGVGFATVYRMVSLLEQIGVITRGITVNYSSLDPEHTMTSARKI